MIGGQAAQAHERANGGGIQQLDQLAELFVGVRGNHAATRINEGTLGFPHHLSGTADLSTMAFAIDLVTRQMYFSYGRVMSLAGQHILRDVYQDGPWTPGSGDVKSLVNHLWQIVDVLDQVVVLCRGTRNAEGVGLLERVGAHQFGRDLASDGHDGNGIHHGVDQACD